MTTHILIADSSSLAVAGGETLRCPEIELTYLQSLAD